MNSLIVFAAVLAVAAAGIVPLGSTSVVQGPSTSAQVVGPDGSAIIAGAPGGRIVASESVGAAAVAYSAPLAYTAPLAYAAPVVARSAIAPVAAYNAPYVARVW